MINTSFNEAHRFVYNRAGQILTSGIISMLVDCLPDVFKIDGDGTLLPYDIDFLFKYKDRLISNFMLPYLRPSEGQEGYNVQGDDIKVVICSRFSEKWLKLNELWNRDYDPLKPFDITLSESGNNEMTVIKDKSTVNDNDSFYGFNSPSPSPTDNSVRTSENEYQRANPYSRNYTRKGNIGNTSLQDLVIKEREVLKYQIIDTVYSDIASVILRGKYKQGESL